MSRSHSEQSVSHLVTQRVKRLRRGRPFSIRCLAELGSSSAIYKAVAQLVCRGELVRVYRGIYMRPKTSQYTGRIRRPGLWDLLSLIASQSRWKLQIHGADAVRQFGLSTQMPVIPIYYTSGPSRSLLVGKAEIRLVHAAPKVMQCPGTRVGMAISALYYLGKDGTTQECVKAIKSTLHPGELATLLDCNLPKWIRVALAE